MVSLRISFAVVAFALTSQVSAHASIWHPSMWGFNRSFQNWPDGTPNDRPQDPLYNRTFDKWWFHGHLDSPPHPDDVLQMPVGESVVLEIACDKGNTNYWPSNPGGDSRDPKNPNLDWACVNAPSAQFHTKGVDDLGGCALSIAYKSNISEVTPEDLVVFSVQQKCVWNRFTHFDIPAEMPPCPNGKCICAWNWAHRADSGSEQMYKVGFQCNPQNAKGTRPLARPRVANRCGHDPLHPELNLTACEPYARQPFFWLQAQRNNIFNDYYDPPLYVDWYGFPNGAQNDIFEGDPTSSPLSLTSSSPLSTPLPTTSSAPAVDHLKIKSSSVTSSTPTDAPTGTPTPPPNRYHHHHHTLDGSCGAPHKSPPTTHSPRDDYDEVYAREEPEIVNRGWSQHRRLSHNYKRHT